MKYLDLTLPSAAENLALDEALLLEAEAGRRKESLRLWEWPEPAVILGAGCKLAEDVNEEACQADHIPILRRSSGGGTVLLSAGCLCFTLVLNYDRDPASQEIRSSIRYILGRIRGQLLDIDSGIGLAGISDLASGGRKFSGNSQQRKRHYFLHHGTILYAMNLGLIGRYLRMPARQPDYRQQREHENFMMNLLTDVGTLKRQIETAWKVETMESEWPSETVRELVETKYGREEWTRRR
jgi:lipoate-protein ligase A